MCYGRNSGCLGLEKRARQLQWRKTETVAVVNMHAVATLMKVCVEVLSEACVVESLDS